MSTHPSTVERVRRAAAQAGSTTNRNPIIGRAVYLRKIDGLLYGDAPEQGFVRGRDFLHPKLRIRFRVPPGFHLSNQPDRVIAQGPGGSAIVFGSAPGAGNRSPYGYLVNVWGRNLRLEDRQTLTINNMPAATGTAQVRSQRGVQNLRLVAIRRGGSMYNFLFLSPPGGGNLDRIYRQITSSFRGVSGAEARSWRPWRLRIITVRRGDTVARLARRMAVDRFREEHFRILNGLGARARLVPGRKVKIVILGQRTAS
jgi:predicted Zn-dependent protease